LAEIQYPATAEQLRHILQSGAAAKHSIELFGGNSKRSMAGAAAHGTVRVSTAELRGLLQYEPRDLTVSVEAGVSLAALNKELARNNQMLPLDGAWSDTATVGGTVAANVSGYRRRLYGTARDFVIGMRFATLEGKFVDTGGMVVKNVAGLDMAKIMIGSFGTLAAIVSVNFKVVPRPAAATTILFSFPDVAAAMAVRDVAIRGFLNPAAVDVLNPVLAAQLNLKGYVLAMLFNGNPQMMERVRREAATWGPLRELPHEEELRFWHALDAVTPRHLEKFREGAVVRLSGTITACGEAMSSADTACHAHAGSGIVRAWFSRHDAAARWLALNLKRGFKGVIECSGEGAKSQLSLWPEPGADFSAMKQIKQMFDPEGLLNRGRFYTHI
jgi:glycolate oxidase FAD binding subunit